jgi:hypothetical protein
MRHSLVRTEVVESGAHHPRMLFLAPSLLGSLSDAHRDRHANGGLVMKFLRGIGMLVLVVMVASA